jgi:hypothetical protein
LTRRIIKKQRQKEVLEAKNPKPEKADDILSRRIKPISERKYKSTYDKDTLIAKKIDKITMVQYLTLNSHLTPQELKEKLKNERVSSLERIVIRMILNGVVLGSIDTLNFIFDRLVGKVTNKIEVSKPDELEEKSLEELIEMKKQLSITNARTLEFMQATNERVIQQEKDVTKTIQNLEGSNKIKPSACDEFLEGDNDLNDVDEKYKL